MRTSRSLTSPERWELGLFLVMLFVGCLALTAILNLSSVPRLFATDIQTPPASPPSASPIPDSQFPIPSPPSPTISAPERVAPAPKANKKVSAPVAPAPDIKTYKGQKYRYLRTLRLRVTAYAPDPRCCWPYPGTTTASGLSTKTNQGKLVASDPRLIPMHSLVSVPGYNNATPVPVLDTGGDIKGHRLDVLLPTFQAAKEWGNKLVDVKIYERID